MSIPKSSRALSRPSPAAGGHYFAASPAVESRPRAVHLHLADLSLELEADRGVFGSREIDLGTLTLLREAPAPPRGGDILDLGCGYGPIAIACALRSPRARVWAVDVNERALELTAANAARAGALNVTALRPESVEGDLRFDAIYSNPPVHIGKAPLHALLLGWLARLRPGAAAYLVVQRNLGSDSLARWLGDQGLAVTRLKSKKGYRILAVQAGPPQEAQMAAQ